MQTGILLLAAGVLLFLTGYAHRQIALYTQGSTNIFAARVVLLVVGVLFGWISSGGEIQTANGILRFMIGFGMVHFPAAVILFIKGQRGAGKS